VRGPWRSKLSANITHHMKKPDVQGVTRWANNCLTRCNMSGPYGKDRLAVSPKSDEAFL